MTEPQRDDAAAAVPTLRFFIPRGVLTVGERARLAVVAEDMFGTELPGVPVTWSSSAPGTVCVEADGTVEALASGEALVVATAGSMTAELSVVASRVSITKFGVHPARLSLCPGEQARIEVDIFDHRGQSRDPRIIAWVSSDPLVARVAPDGTVTALAHGTARLSASTGSLHADAELEVVPLVASNLTLTPPMTTLEVGATEQLKAVVLSQRGTPMADAVLHWQSSDPKVVWVDGTGTVRAVAGGVVKIRVACGTFSATSTVKVLSRRT